MTADVTREPTGGKELREAARLSPDGTLVAIQQGPNDWRVSNGGHYRDSHVADWTPLVPLPEVAALIADGERVRRVRELHAPVDRGTGPQCQGCATHVTFTYWPCPTINALDGEDR